MFENKNLNVEIYNNMFFKKLQDLLYSKNLKKIFLKLSHVSTEGCCIIKYNDSVIFNSYEVMQLYISKKLPYDNIDELWVDQQNNYLHYFDIIKNLKMGDHLEFFYKDILKQFSAFRKVSLKLNENLKLDIKTYVSPNYHQYLLKGIDTTY